MLQEWFNTYNCTTPDEVSRAKREMVQSIILAGLSRSDFFEHASFFGGTALRILYKLPRFSEDLDFSLKTANDLFTLTKYFEFIKDECAMHDMDVSLSIKEKINPNSIESAFLKEKIIWAELAVGSRSLTGKEPELRIKIEVEKNPPTHTLTQLKLITRPYSFYVSTYTPEYLFAGKMHAILYRQWKNRIKGRDWYDLEWFIKNDISINLMHLQERAKQSGNLDESVTLTPPILKQLLFEKIKTLNFVKVKDDISRFVFNPGELNIWSQQYFIDLCEKLKIT